MRTCATYDKILEDTRTGLLTDKAGVSLAVLVASGQRDGWEVTLYTPTRSAPSALSVARCTGVMRELLEVTVGKNGVTTFARYSLHDGTKVGSQHTLREETFTADKRRRVLSWLYAARP